MATLAKIVRDECAENPREANTPMGRMICWHDRHNLGDEHNYRDEENFINALYEELYGVTAEDVGLERYEDIFNAVARKVLFLPLFLYDHSGLVMSTGSFLGRAQHAAWDSGQVGWIYMTHDQIIYEYGAVTPENAEKAISYMKGEVEEYSQYLGGECYGVILYEGKKKIDSVYGFYGSNIETNGIREYIPDGCKVLFAD